MNAPISKLSGAGGKKEEMLVTAGITTLLQLKAVMITDLPRLKEKLPGISVTSLKNWSKPPALDGTYPHEIIDYQKAANPYLARYIEAQWRDNINKCVFMSKHMCIKELLSKIHD